MVLSCSYGRLSGTQQQLKTYHVHVHRIMANSITAAVAGMSIHTAAPHTVAAHIVATVVHFGARRKHVSHDLTHRFHRLVHHVHAVIHRTVIVTTVIMPRVRHFPL